MRASPICSLAAKRGEELFRRRLRANRHDPEGGELVGEGPALHLAVLEPLDNVYQIPKALQRLKENHGTSR